MCLITYWKRSLGMVSGLFLCSFGWSQEVISTSGDVFSNGLHSLEWTIGEPVIATLENGLVLTQGFHQSDGKEKQVIPLPVGWSLFSTYIEPANPSISVVMDEVTSVILAKDGTGHIYWPAFNINTIGGISLGEGFQVKLQAADTLVVWGMAAVPQNTPIQMPQGWSLLGYLRKSPAPIQQMLSAIQSSITLVKSGDGTIFWPQFGVNNIGNMWPGKGYQIKLQSALTFYYQANTLSNLKDLDLVIPRAFPCSLRTGNNLSLCIPDEAWPVKPVPGCEVGVKDSNGEIVGSEVFRGHTIAFPVWGRDPVDDGGPGLAAGSPFSMWLFDSATGDERLLEVAEWIEGDDCFQTDGISIVGRFKTWLPQNRLELHPNPARESVAIALTPGHDGEVGLYLFDATGRLMGTRQFDGQEGVTLLEEWKVGELSPGRYTVKMRTRDSDLSRELIIVH